MCCHECFLTTATDLASWGWQVAKVPRLTSHIYRSGANMWICRSSSMRETEGMKGKTQNEEHVKGITFVGGPSSSLPEGRRAWGGGELGPRGRGGGGGELRRRRMAAEESSDEDVQRRRAREGGSLRSPEEEERAACPVPSARQLSVARASERGFCPRPPDSWIALPGKRGGKARCPSPRGNQTAT